MKNTLFLVLLLGLVACASTQNGLQKNAATTTQTSKSNTIDVSTLPGLYIANLPCPDCGSVRVNLLLEADKRYDKSEETTNDQNIYFETGQWLQKNGKIHLIPDSTESKNMSSIRLFRHDGKALILLNENGKDYTTNATRYRFDKK